jgi:hypothetical protein
MSSATETAEQRFRSAFERLKTNRPEVLPRGTQVSQNNVAKEAGTDPTALRKARYPALIREIQAWIEISDKEKAVRHERQHQRKRAKDEMAATAKRLQAQRDHAQAELISAQRLLLELLEENARLRARLDDLLPPPTPFQK